MSSAVEVPPADHAAPGRAAAGAEAVGPSPLDQAVPLYFVCSRCEYPICCADDLLLAGVPGGTTEYAFHYDLDYLLDLDENVSVPCYCGDETVDTAILVSEKLLEEPLPPASRVMCMESVVESRRFLKGQQAATVSKLMRGAVHASSPTAAAPPPPPTDSANGEPSEAPAVNAASTAGGVESQSSMRRRSSVGALADADGPAVGHEHDQQLAESIPEHGAGRPQPSGPVVVNAAAEPDGGQARERSPTRPSAPTVAEVEGNARAAPFVWRSAEADQPHRPVRRYGATTEARVDLVCVRKDILGHGLAVSSVDRSAVAVPLRQGGGSSSSSAASPGAAEGSSSSGAPPPSSALSRLPQNIVDAVSRKPKNTQWGAPGNLTVQEGFMTVTRATSSAQARWFRDYRCEQRVECPDCHLPLGFVFARAENADGSRLDSPSNNNGQKEKEEEEEEEAQASAAEDDGTAIHRQPHQPPEGVPIFASLANERLREQLRVAQIAEDEYERRNGASGDAAASPPAATASAVERPQSKRAKCEGDRTATGTGESGSAGACADDAAPSLDASQGFPCTFVGLELKRIKQEEWGLREFQDRYHKAQQLESFRELFPEAEELQSLYNRLSALRTQSELYNNLLRKHKEQSDVQASLLSSQKDRLGTYEEKLKTMQQIISAQRVQLEMQTTQLRQQDELVQNHRLQLNAQQKQIDVEQMLLGEQTKTIESQREQIRLMRVHLAAQAQRDELEVRHRYLSRRLRAAQAEAAQANEEKSDEASSGTDALESGTGLHDAPRSPSPTAAVHGSTDGEQKVARSRDASSEEASAPPAPRPASPEPPLGSLANTRRFLAHASRQIEDRFPSSAGSVGSVCQSSSSITGERPAKTTTGSPPAHLRGVYGSARATVAAAVPQTPLDSKNKDDAEDENDGDAAQHDTNDPV